MKEFLIIIKDMKFIGVDDFFEKKDILRNNYNKLEEENKELYKWYFFYQLCILKNPLKRLMWEYINGEEHIKDNVSLLDLEYIRFCDDRSNMIERIKFQKEKQILKNKLLKENKKDGI